MENIKINNRIIENVQFIRYLGVIIDNKLNFHNHIEYTVNKIAKKIGFMKRTCKYLSKK